MATAEQLALLRASTLTWNAWRRERGETAIDLSEAHLARAYLREANLDDADLSGADLSGANLSEASLIRAKLAGADLFQTNLSKANLRGAHLEKARASGANLFAANLSEAHLREVDLGEAIFFGAELTQADLHGADLSWAELQAADLPGAILREANLMEANLCKANLSLAILVDANLSEANLRGADLSGADLQGADLSGADLRGADLSGADLRGADLSRSICVACNFSRAILNGSRIYGLSCRDVMLQDAQQESLYITPRDELEIAVDDVTTAQIVSLVLATADTPRTVSVRIEKLALIVGRFPTERNVVLKALMDDLRKRQFLSLVLNCGSGLGSQNLAATVRKLAGMSRYVVADLSGSATIREILPQIVPQLPEVVWQPVIQDDDSQAALLESLRQYPGVLAPCRYHDAGELILGAQHLDRLPL